MKFLDSEFEETRSNKNNEAVAIIRKIKGKWYVFSHDGKKNLTPKGFTNKEGALKRLRAIEFYKHQKG